MIFLQLNDALQNTSVYLYIFKNVSVAFPTVCLYFQVIVSRTIMKKILGCTTDTETLYVGIQLLSALSLKDKVEWFSRDIARLFEG